MYCLFNIKEVITIPIPTFTGLGPNPQFEDVVRKVNTLVNEIRQLMLGMDSVNMFEVGGWLVTQDELASQDGDVGMSTAGIDPTSIRFWAGNAVPTSAPFKVQQNGKMYATDGEFTGNITASTITGSIVRTAASGARVEMNATEFTSYDSGGIRRVLLSPNTTTYGLSGFEFRDEANVVKGHIFSNSAQMGIIGQAAFGVRSLTGTLTFSGFIDFTSATLTMPQKANAGVSTSATSVADDHNHGFTTSDYIQCYDNLGNPTSKKQWVPYAGSAAHSHTQN